MKADNSEERGGYRITVTFIQYRSDSIVSLQRAATVSSERKKRETDQIPIILQRVQHVAIGEGEVERCLVGDY